MELKVSKWESNKPPSENELREIYRQEDLSPYTWSNASGDVYAAHKHGFHKVIYVLRGKITWILPDVGKEIETGPGDRLEIPRGTTHAARVGSEGVVCLEAHLD
jgi:quercetin dioxygenase-like cupin family protein